MDLLNPLEWNANIVLGEMEQVADPWRAAEFRNWLSRTNRQTKGNSLEYSHLTFIVTLEPKIPKFSKKCKL